MSLTYIGAITQFLVVLGILSQEEAQTLSDGFMAILSLITLLGTLYARWRIGDISVYGKRK